VYAKGCPPSSAEVFLAKILMPERDSLFQFFGEKSGLVIKEAMNLCGMKVGSVRPPLAPLPNADREVLRGLLEGLGILKG
jgi:dihydrodipicolinate synthase/N-acetylneuraminate lyase